MKTLITQLFILLLIPGAFARQLNHEDFNPNNSWIKTKGVKFSESSEVDSLCDKAKMHYIKAQYNDGILLLKKANAKEEGNYRIKTAMAWAYLQIGDYDSAIMGFNTALKLQPNDSCARRNLILCYAQKRDYKGACAKAREYIRSYPDDPGGYYTFMLAQFSHDRYGAAIENGQKAVALYRKTNNKAIYSAQYWLAKSYYAEKDYAHSDEVFQWLRDQGVKVEEKYRVHL